MKQRTQETNIVGFGLIDYDRRMLVDLFEDLGYVGAGVGRGVLKGTGDVEFRSEPLAEIFA